MRAVVVVPGRAPQWVVDHARALAHHLADDGRVMVAFTGRPEHDLLPGQPGGASVIGHSDAGYPIWTGRLGAALGMRKRRDVVIVVLWRGSNGALALASAAIARLRRERVVLDVPQHAPTSGRVQGLLRRLLCALAGERVEGDIDPVHSGRERSLLAVCHHDTGLADLVVRAFESMADDAARDWWLTVQVDPRSDWVAPLAARHRDRVRVARGAVTRDLTRDADLMLAAYGGEGADLVRREAQRGAAGVLVGPQLAERVARCHDGVWLAKRDVASVLVALEASSGATLPDTVPVPALRRWGDRVVERVKAAA